MLRGQIAIESSAQLALTNTVFFESEMRQLWGFRVNGRLAGLVLFLGNRRPGCIRVEAFHLLEFVQGFGPKVLLVHYAVVTDHEGPHTRYVVLSGCGDKCKAADHDSLHHEIDFTERRLPALSFQDLEKIPMIRLRASEYSLVQLLGRRFHRSDRPTCHRDFATLSHPASREC